MKSPRHLTIYDIAADLKVSPSTVSRALKGHFSIGKEMTETIQNYAKEKGYRPNFIAASLRRNKTNTIGVIVPWINRPFISTLISGIEEEGRMHGYNILISQSHDSYENEVENCRTLYDTRIGALIVSLAMESTKYKHFDQFVANKIPIVFVDRITDQFTSDRVIIDNYAAGYAATEHLIQQGCKRIAHFGGLSQRLLYRERQRGYTDALRNHNLELIPELIIEGNILSLEEGQKMAQRVVESGFRPDGIFTANDSAAVGSIQYLKKAGIRVPHDIAVIGFNNDPITTIIDPALSSVSHPAFEMGKLAVKQVLKQQAHMDIISSETIVLKTEVIVRKSSMRMEHA